MWVYTGLVFDSKNTSSPGLEDSGKVSSAYLVTVAVVLFTLIAAYSPTGLLWQKAFLSSKESPKSKAA